MSDYTMSGDKIDTGMAADQNHNNQIKCDVSECKYHEGKDICQASMITVSPCAANCTADHDTACATFEMKH